jgi:hypothetical protein
MAYVGNSGVANFAYTSPGTAIGVVADAYNGWGDDVGDHGVIVLYASPVPVVNNFILMESSGYVLQEDGSKIIMESD